MPLEAILPHGVMEGNGSYNKHATMPADGAALAIPLLEQATRDVDLSPAGSPIVIADYGSSQGKNSLAPMNLAVRNLRERVEHDRAIFVFHIDQPSNDFNSLFKVLSSDSQRYTLHDAKVFPCAIGRSFYEQVLPPNSVHLGWSSFAVVWLSQIPSLIPGHFFPVCSTGAVRAMFEKQSAEDWKTFLTLRGRELRPGGHLVVVLPAMLESGVTPFHKFMDHANVVLEELVHEGVITAHERSEMVIATFPRRKSELLAPFKDGKPFQGLMVERCEESELADRGWDDYQLDGDRESLARKQALFFRAVFSPSLASTLLTTRGGNCDAANRFTDRLQERLTERLIEHPTQTVLLVQRIVLSKS